MLISTAHHKDHADVIIVGAGVAGLSAAHRLISAGLSVSVLEAAPRPGGRMATEEVDGYRLDRVGPFVSTSHPGLPDDISTVDVELRPFAPGVLVHAAGRLHRMGETVRRPGQPGSARGALTVARALASAPRPLDEARLAAWLTRLAGTSTARLAARPERTALASLSSRGLPTRTLDGFLRPLLSALLCDPELTTSSRSADLVLRDFARGRLAVPAGGAVTLPEHLAATLPPGTVLTGVRVKEASINRVSTEEYGELTCRALVVATGAREAAELLPGLRVPPFHPVTVVHHTAPSPPPTGASLVLDAERLGPIAHTAVMSQVDPSRAPEGRTLITSTVLGPPPPQLEARARAQLSRLYGVPTDGWETLAVHHTRDAVPAMAPPHDLHRPVRVLAGLYVCGDHRTTSTVRGAMHSARRVTDAIVQDFAVRRPGTPPLPAAA
ncbi:NAD(P)/FAD-dependent oxidoreductase [Streptomyces sp. NPDC005963]|uniref:NAD(P)/FAD-dependent oxidoreductase n=1 Tax=Streptomyces sp. NPDC005963 TaxID=3156721 RepID=UPI0033EF9EC3